MGFLAGDSNIVRLFFFEVMQINLARVRAP